MGRWLEELKGGGEESKVGLEMLPDALKVQPHLALQLASFSVSLASNTLVGHL